MPRQPAGQRVSDGETEKACPGCPGQWVRLEGVQGRTGHLVWAQPGKVIFPQKDKHINLPLFLPPHMAAMEQNIKASL